MPAMAFRLMARFMKFMLKTALWMARMFERCLETLDGKDIPNVERPMVEHEDREQVNQVNDHRADADTVVWEEVPIPGPQPTNQVNERRGVNVTIICPLCTNIMRLKPAGRGGWFYGCSEYPTCRGYRNKVDKRPGPVKNVRNLRQHFGEAVWRRMEEQKCNGTFLRLPTPEPRVLDRCWFCDMNPSDHLGRDCPMRRGTGP